MICHGDMSIVMSQWACGLSIVMSHIPLLCYYVARCITKDKQCCTISLEITTQVYFPYILFSLHYSVILYQTWKLI